MKKILLAISVIINLTVFSPAYADDTTPPVITAPADQTFTATSFPATPSLAIATATDDTDPNPVVTYDPTSFPAGTTTVTWTARDATGNTSTTTSLVTVTDTTSNTSTHLDITTDVDVPSNCAATDTDGVTHNYPTDSATNSYLGICALEKAVQDGSLSGVGLSNQFPSLGLFVTKINDVDADPSSQYWALYQNGDFAQLGITSLPVTAGDKIVLELQDFSGNNLGDRVTINIRSLLENAPTSSNVTGRTSSGSGGGGSSRRTVEKTEETGKVLGVSTEGTFDAKKALGFLTSQQKEDGSFGEELYTDWVAISLASYDTQGQDIKPIIKLIKYLSENKTKGKLVTDFERRAMALMSLGLNPYNTNGENYIEKITSSFDGNQFGDKNEDNDDIFALIVLQNAGFAADDKMISSGINFVLDRQEENGSWDESIDMTGAGIVALSAFKENEKVAQALKEAKGFLKINQNANGSWKNNTSSTSWAIGGILGLEEEPKKWKDTTISPLDYLGSNQDTDGSMKVLSVTDEDQKIKNKIWETAYALTANSGKTWNQIMQKFEQGPIAPTTEVITLKAAEVTKTPATPKKVTTNTAPKPAATETAPILNLNNQVNAPDTQPLEENKIEEKSWFMKVFGAVFGI